MPLRRLMKALRRASGVPSSPPYPSAPVEQSTPATPVPPPPAEQKNESTNRNQDIPELILYGRSSCPYCLRVDRVIEELGVEDNITRRNTGFGTEWREDLRKRTGRTQVPCLFIDGEPMFESLDIIAWIKANLT